jgi:hypothetical protein
MNSWLLVAVTSATPSSSTPIIAVLLGTTIGEEVDVGFDFFPLRPCDNDSRPSTTMMQNNYQSSMVSANIKHKTDIYSPSMYGLARSRNEDRVNANPRSRQSNRWLAWDGAHIRIPAPQTQSAQGSNATRHASASTVGFEGKRDTHRSLLAPGNRIGSLGRESWICAPR